MSTLCINSPKYHVIDLQIDEKTIEFKKIFVTFALFFYISAVYFDITPEKLVSNVYCAQGGCYQIKLLQV